MSTSALTPAKQKHDETRRQQHWAHVTRESLNSDDISGPAGESHLRQSQSRSDSANVITTSYRLERRYDEERPKDAVGDERESPAYFAGENRRTLLTHLLTVSILWTTHVRTIPYS